MIRRIKNSLEEDLIDFAEHTSAHGIPRAYISNGRRRILWLLLFFLCLTLFTYQAYLIVERFNSKPILVSVEIKFERIAFPSVTVCNLNPYKFSLAKEANGIGDTLKAFNDAVTKIGEGRSKRSIFNMNEIDDKDMIVGVRINCPYELYPHHSQCICSYAHMSDEYYNCYPSKQWNSFPCHKCHKNGICSRDYNLSSSTTCYCTNDFCLLNIQDIHVSLSSSSSVYINESSSSQYICSYSYDWCYPIDEWSIHSCRSCNWKGECIRSILRDDDCLCRDEICHAVTNDHKMRKKKGSIRVIRQSMKNQEKTISRYEALMAVNSFCNCDNGCIGIMDTIFRNGSTICLCFYNKKSNQLWPCYESHKWKERKCVKCTTMGDCPYSNSLIGKEDCICVDDIKICVRIEKKGGNELNETISSQLVNFWDILPTTTLSPIQRKKEKTEKAFGLQGLKDPIALKAKAVENVIFSVQGMNASEKEGLSYSKKEFITKCSFNGRECSIDKDFSIHSDPSYGNCFTFNYDLKENMTSERAGPAYGLRFQVFVNVSDYLPTTESAGVRLTVHSPEEQPFPDTLGYSAPTGFVSSFGIRLKHMTRLPSPYGECIEEGKDDDYIYRDKQYSTEGCQRSCLQKYLVKSCGCGDPRFPPYKQMKNCPFDDPDKRDCLKKEIRYAARFIDEIGCSCRQPCRQLVYSVSYSAARWPTLSSMSNSHDCPYGLTHNLCLEYFREQSAMIEVFFEQLNYESLVESEAYGLPNLLSDFGGQLGLWMGVSVITISECAILIFDIILSLFCCGRSSIRKISLRKRSNTNSFRHSDKRHSYCPSNQINENHSNILPLPYNRKE